LGFLFNLLNELCGASSFEVPVWGAPSLGFLFNLLNERERESSSSSAFVFLVEIPVYSQISVWGSLYLGVTLWGDPFKGFIFRLLGKS
jgi:hypothetical protein